MIRYGDDVFCHLAIRCSAADILKKITIAREAARDAADATAKVAHAADRELDEQTSVFIAWAAAVGADVDDSREARMVLRMNELEESMSLRRFLRGVNSLWIGARFAAGSSISPLIAGCLSMDENMEHEITLTDVQRLETEIPLEFDVSLRESVLSDQEIPLIELTIKQLGESIIELEHDSLNSFPAPLTSESKGVWLPNEKLRDIIIEKAINGDGIIDEHGMLRDVDVSDCVTSDFWVRDGVWAPAALHPGEETSQGFGIVGLSDERNVCPEAGEYRFETSYSAQSNDDHIADFLWGFTIELG